MIQYLCIYIYLLATLVLLEYAYSYSTLVVAVLCVLSTMHTCMDTYSVVVLLPFIQHITHHPDHSPYTILRLF